MSVRGDRIVPSLDGGELPAVTDGTFAAGRVGVRAVADQRSRWDALRVTSASGEPLYEETFTTAAALDAFAIPPSEARLVAVAARPADGADPDAIVDLTERAAAGEPWDAPAGRWRIDTFTARELADTGPGSFRRNYLDVLDDEAIGRFLDAVPGEYLRRFPWAAGTVLRGFADDEPFIASADAHFQAIPWSRSLERTLARRGLSRAAVLAAVHDDLGREGRQLRGAFWRAVSDRFAAAYYEQQGRWMDRHDVEFVSNPLWDEYGPAEQIRSTGNLHALNQWAQVPGTDLVFDHFQRGYHRTLSRWPASTAHQLGRERVYLEAMGAMGWGVTPALTRAVLGGFAARGVNFTVLHATYTDPGFIPYPPPFQPINPWWDESRPLNEWIGRVMEAGRAAGAARTVLLQPQRAAEAWQDTPRVAEIDTAFTAAANALEDRQVDFDLLDEGALDDDPALRLHAAARGGRLDVGRQAYPIAVLPRTPMLSLGAVRTLDRFVRGGGTLVAVGDLPAAEAGGDDAGLARALAALFARRGAIRAGSPDAAAAAVADAGGAAATLAPAAPALRVLRLERGGERAFLVVNEDDEPVATSATFPAAGAPERWDPETGAVRPVALWRAAGRAATTVPLRLGANETAVIVFPRRGGSPPAHAVSSPLPVERVERRGQRLTAVVTATEPGRWPIFGARGERRYRGLAELRDPLTPIALDGDWTVRLEGAGGDPIVRPPGSWTAFAPAFSGAATYERELTLEAAELAGRRWTLDLGSVRDVAEVRVNGHALPPRLWPPYAVDVTSVLRPGRNAIAVRVTNTGANARGETLASGLLGPVALVPQRRLEVALEPAGERERLLELEAEPLALAPGQRRTVAVAVRDLAGRSGDVRLTVAGEGVSAAPAATTVRLDRDGEGEAAITLAAPATAALPGTAAIVLRAEDVERRVPVRIDAATRLGTASASSSYAGRPPELAIDGIADSELWDSGQGWNDGTPDAYPDELTVAFAAAAPIGRVRVHTLDSSQYPASAFGLADFDVQLRAGGEWRTVGEVRANTQGVAELAFAPVEADAVRLVVRAARVSYSRVVEIEALPTTTGRER